MDVVAGLILRWWRPLAVAAAGVVLMAVPSTARWLGACSLVLAVGLAVSTARSGATPSGPADVVGDLSRAPGADEARIAMSELAHERDVSIARAAQADDRERLARDRLASLAPLEPRIESAERRALDAERRLAEIDERVERAIHGDDGLPNDDLVVDPVAEGSSSDGSDADRLRARLSRSAARKRRGRDR